MAHLWPWPWISPFQLYQEVGLHYFPLCNRIPSSLIVFGFLFFSCLCLCAWPAAPATAEPNISIMNMPECVCVCGEEDTQGRSAIIPFQPQPAIERIHTNRPQCHE